MPFRNVIYRYGDHITASGRHKLIAVHQGG
jgi:hypothetical protein